MRIKPKACDYPTLIDYTIALEEYIIELKRELEKR